MNFCVSQAQVRHPGYKVGTLVLWESSLSGQVLPGTVLVAAGAPG